LLTLSMAVEKSVGIIATIAKHGKLPAPPIRVLFPALSAMAARMKLVVLAGRRVR
jgi:hypothetical protein